MLQRSPSYILSLPSRDMIAEALIKVLGEKRGFAVTRRKNIAQQRSIVRFCQRFPRASRAIIRWLNSTQLPKDYPVDVHLNPRYDPWEQRLCAVPDADLFRAISSGKASIATDGITTFTENGIQLASGDHLDADIIVTATGLNLLPVGGIKFVVDGDPVHLPECVVYRGMMLTDVPNLAFAIGYTTSSWTLKVGLLCEQLCQLLTHMDVHGYDTVYPHNTNADMPTRPFLDFASGYVQRSVDTLPRQGDGAPWLTSMDFYEDLKLLKPGSVASQHLRFRDSTASASPRVVAATGS